MPYALLGSLFKEVLVVLIAYHEIIKKTLFDFDLRCFNGELIRLIVIEGKTVLRKRAAGTFGLFWSAVKCSKFHHGLIKCTRMGFSHQFAGFFLKFFKSRMGIDGSSHSKRTC